MPLPPLTLTKTKWRLALWCSQRSHFLFLNPASFDPSLESCCFFPSKCWSFKHYRRYSTVSMLSWTTTLCWFWPANKVSDLLSHTNKPVTSKHFVLHKCCTDRLKALSNNTHHPLRFHLNLTTGPTLSKFDILMGVCSYDAKTYHPSNYHLIIPIMSQILWFSDLKL